MAPEVIQEAPYAASADIWSLGPSAPYPPRARAATAPPAHHARPPPARTWSGAGAPRTVARRASRRCPRTAPHRRSALRAGITAIELAELNPPHWELKPPLRALFKIPSAPPPTLSRPEAWSAGFSAFLDASLVKEPSDRLPAGALLALPFVTGAGDDVALREALKPLAAERSGAAPRSRANYYTTTLL
jgi:serine/threonine protein kinase